MMIKIRMFICISSFLSFGYTAPKNSKSFDNSQFTYGREVHLGKSSLSLAKVLYVATEAEVLEKNIKYFATKRQEILRLGSDIISETYKSAVDAVLQQFYCL